MDQVDPGFDAGKRYPNAKAKANILLSREHRTVSLLFGAKEEFEFRRDKETRMCATVMNVKVFADKFALIDEKAGYIWHL